MHGITLNIPADQVVKGSEEHSMLHDVFSLNSPVIEILGVKYHVSKTEVKTESRGMWFGKNTIYTIHAVRMIVV